MKTFLLRPPYFLFQETFHLPFPYNLGSQGVPSLLPAHFLHSFPLRPLCVFSRVINESLTKDVLSFLNNSRREYSLLIVVS